MSDYDQTHGINRLPSGAPESHGGRFDFRDHPEADPSVVLAPPGGVSERDRQVLEEASRKLIDELPGLLTQFASNNVGWLSGARVAGTDVASTVYLVSGDSIDVEAVSEYAADVVSRSLMDLPPDENASASAQVGEGRVQVPPVPRGEQIARVQADADLLQGIQQERHVKFVTHEYVGGEDYEQVVSGTLRHGSWNADGQLVEADDFRDDHVRITTDTGLDRFVPFRDLEDASVREELFVR